MLNEVDLKNTNFREQCFMCYAPTINFRHLCIYSKFEKRKHDDVKDGLYDECKYFDITTRQCHNET